MPTQTGSSDTFVEAKPGSSAARINQTAPASSGGSMVFAALGGGLVLGLLLGVGIMSGRHKTVETTIGSSKIQVAASQDETISALRNEFQKLSADKQAAADALATAVRLDQIPTRFRGKSSAETVQNLTTADADLTRLTSVPTFNNTTGNSGTPTIGGKPAAGGVTPTGLVGGGVPTRPDELKTLIAQIDAAVAKSPIWLSAYHKLGENAAFDDNARKLARVMSTIGAIDDPSKATLDQIQKAVKAVQRDNKLKDDAVVGQKTWNAIKKLVDEKRKG